LQYGDLNFLRFEQDQPTSIRKVDEHSPQDSHFFDHLAVFMMGENSLAPSVFFCCWSWAWPQVGFPI